MGIKYKKHNKPKATKEKSTAQNNKIAIPVTAPRPKAIPLRGPRYYIEHARDYPIYGCWVMKGWQESGMTPVVIARQQTPDKVVFASYVVDYYCLGVKDALCNGDFSLKRFDQNLVRLCAGEPESCEVDFAHELVYGAIDFARKYGFEPHPDFKLAGQVLDPAEMHPPHLHLKFGKDGKPLYISGPYDNPEAIVAKLSRTAGKGKFDYLVSLDELSS